MKEKESLINSLQLISEEINKIYSIMIESERDEDYFSIINAKNVNDALQSLWKVESSEELKNLINSLKNRS